MTLILCLIIGGYAFVLMAFIVIWFRLQQQKDRTTGSLEKISVVIAVRNEVHTIGSLLDDLRSQRLHEIIVVNDHSEDLTVSKIEERLIQMPNLKLIKLEEGHGKKRALHAGITAATGNIIATLDGDCRAGSKWAETVHARFSHSGVQMIFGGVRIMQHEGFFAHVQAMEFASLIGTGAVTLSLGMPTMCNGANLAFRKSAFEEVGGYEGNWHIPSGDDEFLLRKIFARYPRGVRFVTDPDHVVSTHSLQSCRDFFFQRLRWASKWKAAQGDRKSALLALFIFLVHVSIVGVWIMMWNTRTIPGIGIALLAGKTLLECIFLRRVMKFLDSSWKWSAFIVLQIAYTPYVVVMGIMANLLSYRWKGRKIR